MTNLENESVQDRRKHFFFLINLMSHQDVNGGSEGLKRNSNAYFTVFSINVLNH